jgi:hypothetical protein
MSQTGKPYYKISRSKLLRPLLENALFALGVHWFFQCILQMDRTERFFKLAVDLVFTALFDLILRRWFAFVPALVLGWILAHTLNFLFNGQAFVILKHFGNVRTSADEIERRIVSMRRRMLAEPSLKWAAIFGSLSRGELKETSDLDMRVIRYPGFVNGIRACLFLAGERTRAHRDHFPLDVLLLDSPRLLKRLRPDEPPRVIYDASAVASKKD